MLGNIIQKIRYFNFIVEFFFACNRYERSYNGSGVDLK
jgi:hypothetical protein